MNTERYVWPVIIAASLHGALLLSSSNRTVSPTVKEVPLVLPPLPPIEMTPEETPVTAAGETAGGPTPLPPSLPDILTDLPKETVFTMPVTERIVSITPVTELPKTMGELGGPGGGPPGPPSVLNVTNLDHIPRAIVQPSPNYPDAMRHAGITGSVTVEFVVDTTGRVVRAEAVRWTHSEFVDPAVRAVLRWRFEPGTMNGRKVSFRMAVPIEFNAAL